MLSKKHVILILTQKLPYLARTIRGKQCTPEQLFWLKLAFQVGLSALIV